MIQDLTLFRIKLEDYLPIDSLTGKIIFSPEVKQVILDVSAFEGAKSLPLLEESSDLTVVAFEPLVEKWNKLRGVHPRFFALPFAVSTMEGVATFFETANGASSSLRPFNPKGLEEWLVTDGLEVVREHQVPTIPLEKVLERITIESIEFLKIDAQGHDLDVVKSAGSHLQRIQRIEIEVAVTQNQLYQKDQVLNFMVSQGFCLVHTESQTNGQEENLTFVNSRYMSKDLPNLGDAHAFLCRNGMKNLVSKGILRSVKLLVS